MKQTSGTFLVSIAHCGNWGQGCYKVTDNMEYIICLEDWELIKSYVDNFYRSQTQDDIDSANDKRDNQQASSQSYIYIIQAENGLCKIGISTNPKRRLSTLQTGSPVSLKLIFQFEGNYDTEEQLHNMFAHKQQHGEWFRLSNDDLASIAEIIEEQKNER